MKKLVLILFVLFAATGIFAQSKDTQKMNVEFGGKSYELNLFKNKTAEVFAEKVNGKSLSMTKYGGFEFYSYTALDYGKSDSSTSAYKAGHVYYNLDFQAISVAYADHSIGSAKAVEIGEFADKSVCGALKNLSSGSVFVFKKSESAASVSSGSKKLVVYYSLTETTAKFAKRIADETGADLFRLECKVPYSKNMNECDRESKADIKNGVHRELASVPDLSGYDVVFVGTPVWSDDMANPVETFLLQADLRGKTVVPFCTYWSSGRDSTLRRICDLSKGAKTLGGIGQAHTQTADVSAWLKKIGLK
ncbi:flavodoxin [uncultured Treponema sp.]|uniref:flavodoxin n=1 Tax=uncultured Treponema sp. TaxID=162155 RepID=UPI0025D8E01D|nr:flavodoxin [uncultured Treponema sp.]